MTGVGSDNDFNDVILQIKGATGSATPLDEVMNAQRDWRGFESGRQILELVGRQKEEEIPIVANPPVIIEPPDEEPPISIEPPPSDEGGGNDPEDGEEPVPLPPVIIEDKAGDSLGEAAPTIPSSTGKLYQDSVSIDDKDYYFFTLGASNEIKISADGMGKDVDLELLDNEGNIIASSKNEGGEKEIIEREVEHGSYKLLVTSPNPEPTAYNLDLITKPLLEGITTSGSEELVYLQTQESLPLIGADEFGKRSDNFKDNPLYPDIDGAGYSAVVIDSGINVDHPAFGNDSNGDGVSDRIKYQYDFTSGDENADESDVSKKDKRGHGTSVSSIIASEDEKYSGVALGTNIIALKVVPDASLLDKLIEGLQFPDLRSREEKIKELTEESPTFLYQFEQALQWVIENASNPEYNITAVNLSLGGGNYENYYKKEGISDEIETLTKLGVIVVASAGNGYKNYEMQEGLAYPAADPNTIAVGATYGFDLGLVEPDNIISSSQRSGNFPMVFAPGGLIKVAGLEDDKSKEEYYETFNETSAAAPHVTGMAILAQQLAEEKLGRRLSPEEFRELLISTSDEIKDEEIEDDEVKNTGLTFNRVNMTNLADAISNLDLVKVEIIESESELDSSSESYASIMIDNDFKTTTPIENQSRISPFDWMYIKEIENEKVPIKIELFNRKTNENGNELQEQIDINPQNGIQELNLLYDTKTGNIWDEDNDRNHYRGDEIVRTGDNEENRATITFKVNSLSEINPVNVNISRVKGELDLPVFDGSLFDASDFFTLISINDSEEVRLEGEENQNEISPNWNVSELVEDESEEVPISIKIFDKDSQWIIGNENDELNINPKSERNNLNLIYNRNTGEIRDEITGEVYGKQGEEINIKGSEENNPGEIWFSVR